MNRLSAVCLFFHLVLAAAPAVEALPVAAYVAEPDFRTLKLSPSGKEIGILGHRDHADYWFLIDVQTMQPLPGPAFSNLRVENFWWKGEDQVLFLLTEFTGNSYFQVYDRKRKAFRDLRTFSGNTGTIVNPLINDPEHMLVSTATKTGVDLRKLDIRTGKLETLEKNPGGIFRWLTDRSGRAVAGFGQENDTWFMLTRDAGAGKWKRVSLGKLNWPDFWPQAVFNDQRRILGHDYASADTASVVVWDPATNTQELLFRSTEVDPASNLAWGDDETLVRAITYETDRPHFFYLDPADAALAKQIDQALPDTTNSVVSIAADETRLIIHSESDVVPGCFFLLDRGNGKLISLGGTRLELSTRQMSSTRHFAFPGADGLQVTARLHVPISAGNKPPLIVVVGPDLAGRTTRTFQPRLQLLASRGYAVLSVNQRGVDGFGRRFANAGKQQVDAGMADDLSEAVKQVVAQGLVDPSRIAILGQDEGGVLALHTLVRHPALFRAWINLETPMDRDAIALGSLAVGLHELESYGLKFPDEIKYRNYRETINPALQLKSVRVPSFHHYSYGMDDRSGHKVPSALKKAGLPCIYLVAPPSPHVSEMTVELLGRLRHEEAVRTYTEMIRFLDQYLMPAAIR